MVSLPEHRLLYLQAGQPARHYAVSSHLREVAIDGDRRHLEGDRLATARGEPDVLAGSVSFAMNTDLGARALSGNEISAVVAAWRAGAISRDTMLERLKRGEVLPDGRSIAQERALIHGKAV